VVQGDDPTIRITLALVSTPSLVLPSVKPKMSIQGLCYAVKQIFTLNRQISPHFSTPNMLVLLACFVEMTDVPIHNTPTGNHPLQPSNNPVPDTATEWWAPPPGKCLAMPRPRRRS
jgi:hypothetical protein